MEYGAEALKKICKEKGITLKQMSKDTGIPVNTLYTITQRGTKGLSANILEKLSNTYWYNPLNLSQNQATQDFDACMDKAAEIISRINSNSKDKKISEQSSYIELKRIVYETFFLRNTF